jgi:hypothetical protein
VGVTESPAGTFTVNAIPIISVLGWQHHIL